MAVIETGRDLQQLETQLRRMGKSTLVGQAISQQGAVHAISYLLQHGCNERNALLMLQSLRACAEAVRAEMKRRGMPELFSEDQTGFM